MAGLVDRFGTGAVVGIGRGCAVVVESAFCGIEVVACLGGDRLRLRDDRVDRLPEGGRFQYVAELNPLDGLESIG